MSGKTVKPSIYTDHLLQCLGFRFSSFMLRKTVKKKLGLLFLRPGNARNCFGTPAGSRKGPIK